MPYPASSYPEGVDLTIIAGNQLHQVINGEANEVVSTTSGDIPSVRKALADSMMFKVPVEWVQGEVTTDPLETRLYNGQPYWAPEATSANPITLGSSPVATTDWLLAPQGYRNDYNLGKYQAGILISDSLEYVVYNGKSYFAISPPYTTTSTTPDNDTNMFEGGYTTVQSANIIAIARSLNVEESQVIYSTDTTTVLDDVLYIYDASEQATWGKPSDVGSGETIVSVVGSALTTSGGGYELVSRQWEIWRDEGDVRGWGAVNGSDNTDSIQKAIDSKEVDARAGIRKNIIGTDSITSSELLISHSAYLEKFSLNPITSSMSTLRSEWSQRGKFQDITIVGTGSSNGMIGINLDNNNTPTTRFCLYNDLNHLRLADLDIGVKRKAGWGNGIRKSDITACNYGLLYENAGGNYASSGDCHVETYFSGCDIGVANGWGWTNTYINCLFEANRIGFTNDGPSPVLINPWFESNSEYNVQSGQGVVCLGGRDTSGGNDPKPQDWSGSGGMYEERQVHTVLGSYGINMFRDAETQLVKVTGVGVEKLHNYGTSNTGNMDIWGAATDERQGVTIRSLTTRYAVTPQDGESLSDLETAKIELGGVGAGAGGNGGRGSIKFSIGEIYTDGVHSTPVELHWTIGRYYTGSAYKNALIPDGTVNIGTPSNMVDDLYITNAPTVGSDYRIKTGRKSIPQEMCDFAMSVEFEMYKLKNSTSNRYHTGIVVDEDFISGLKSTIEIKECAAICHDVFTDEDNNPIDVEIMKGITLGDMWRVRYDEWQNIILEAMRRKINAM